MNLGKYKLVAEIARGGMGIVYLAMTEGMGGFSKLLVVKELKPELVEDANFLAMFLEEARLSARLSHPNIVQTYEIGVDDDRYFIVMDYLEGAALSRLLRKAPPSFTSSMQLQVICEMLQGLHYAHTMRDLDGSPLGLVHRDVSPQNVFLTFDGQAKLLDFGVARASDSRNETRSGVLKGKPAYMAPEQFRGVVHPSLDIFAAGVMIWEAVAGRRMWDNTPELELMQQAVLGKFPSLAVAVPGAAPELVRICAKAMSVRASDRHESAAALRAELVAYLKAEHEIVPMSEIGAIGARSFEKERAAIEEQILLLKQSSRELSGASSRRCPPALMEKRSSTPAAAHVPMERPSRTSLTPSIVETGALAATTPPASKRTRRLRAMMPIVVASGVLALLSVMFVKRGMPAPAAAAEQSTARGEPSAPVPHNLVSLLPRPAEPSAAVSPLPPPPVVADASAPVTATRTPALPPAARPTALPHVRVTAEPPKPKPVDTEIRHER